MWNCLRKGMWTITITIPYPMFCSKPVTTELEEMLLIYSTRCFFLFFLRFYLFISENTQRGEREADTQAEGEAGSTPGVRCGTRSWDSRITPWAKGRHQTAEPPRDPHLLTIFNIWIIVTLSSLLVPTPASCLSLVLMITLFIFFLNQSKEISLYIFFF